MISAQVYTVSPSVLTFIASVNASQMPLRLQDQQQFALFEGELNYYLYY